MTIRTINRKLLLLAMLLLSLLLFSGCTDSPKDTALNDTDYVAGNPDGADTENTHNLSADGALQVEGSLNGNNEIFLVPQFVYTNSEEISVTNNSDIDLNIYLYSETDPENPIRQGTISGGKTETFTGLTASFTYDIGIGAEISTQFSITVTD